MTLEKLYVRTVQYVRRRTYLLPGISKGNKYIIDNQPSQSVRRWHIPVVWKL